MKNMMAEMRRLHEKFGFKHNGGENMLFRMNLIMEEVGEISACLTKGKPGIEEEHADLLILLLGNCVALDIDIEKEFWQKVKRMDGFKIRSSGGNSRLVSKLSGGADD